MDTCLKANQRALCCLPLWAEPCCSFLEKCRASFRLLTLWASLLVSFMPCAERRGGRSMPLCLTAPIMSLLDHSTCTAVIPLWDRLLCIHPNNDPMPCSTLSTSTRPPKRVGNSAVSRQCLKKTKSKTQSPQCKSSKHVSSPDKDCRSPRFLSALA